MDTAQERNTLDVPSKKRRSVKIPTDQNSVPRLEEERVLSDIIEPQPFLPMSRTARRNQKQPKAALPQPVNEASSSKMMHQPCQDGARAGTSATGLSELVPDHGFCLDTLKKSFYQLECSKVLQDIKPTKELSEILEKSFMKLTEKITRIKTNSNRFRKKHHCISCYFSISHQCMSLDLTRGVPFGADMLDSADIIPDRTVVCHCGFAFYHAHLRRWHAYQVENKRRFMCSQWICYNHSVSFSCPKCYIIFDMMSRTNNICYDLAEWDNITGVGRVRKEFYHTVQSRLRYATDTLSPDEFYACSKGCCLLFHRCSGESEDPGAKGLQSG